MSDSNVKIDLSHVSSTFIEGKVKGEQHAILQKIPQDGKTMLGYTDVRPDGTVGGSGFTPQR